MIMDVEAGELKEGDCLVKTVKIVKVIDLQATKRHGPKKRILLDDGTVYIWDKEHTVTISTHEVGRSEGNAR